MPCYSLFLLSCGCKLRNLTAITLEEKYDAKVQGFLESKRDHPVRVNPYQLLLVFKLLLLDSIILTTIKQKCMLREKNTILPFWWNFPI